MLRAALIIAALSFAMTVDAMAKASCAASFSNLDNVTTSLLQGDPILEAYLVRDENGALQLAPSGRVALSDIVGQFRAKYYPGSDLGEMGRRAFIQDLKEHGPDTWTQILSYLTVETRGFTSEAKQKAFMAEILGQWSSKEWLAPDVFVPRLNKVCLDEVLARLPAGNGNILAEADALSRKSISMADLSAHFEALMQFRNTVGKRISVEREKTIQTYREARGKASKTAQSIVDAYVVGSLGRASVNVQVKNNPKLAEEIAQLLPLADRYARAVRQNSDALMQDPFLNRLTPFIRFVSEFGR